MGVCSCDRVTKVYFPNVMACSVFSVVYPRQDPHLPTAIYVVRSVQPVQLSPMMLLKILIHY